jgi:biopolymer transport protein ExbB
MSTSLVRRLLLSSLCLASTASLAQDASIAAAPAAAAPTAPPAPTVSVEKAYQREYALLEAQKRELTARITERSPTDRAATQRVSKAKVSALENRVFALRSEAESAAEALNRAEQAAFSAAENSRFSQRHPGASQGHLGSYGDSTLQSRMRSRNGQPRSIEHAVPDRHATLEHCSSQVRREPGAFFLADGSEVQGQIIRFGNIAAFGVSDKASGALVPARWRAFPLCGTRPPSNLLPVSSRANCPATLQTYLVRECKRRDQ